MLGLDHLIIMNANPSVLSVIEDKAKSDFHVDSHKKLKLKNENLKTITLTSFGNGLDLWLEYLSELKSASDYFNADFRGLSVWSDRGEVWVL